MTDDELLSAGPDALRETVIGLRDDLAKRTREVLDSAREVAALEKDRSAHEANSLRMAREIKALRESLADEQEQHRLDCGNAGAVLGTAHRERDALRESLDRVGSELAEMTRIAAEHESARTQAEIAKGAAEQSVAQLDEIVTEWQRAHAVWEDRRTALTTERDTARARLEEAEALVDLLKTGDKWICFNSGGVHEQGASCAPPCSGPKISAYQRELFERRAPPAAATVPRCPGCDVPAGAEHGARCPAEGTRSPSEVVGWLSATGHQDLSKAPTAPPPPPPAVATVPLAGWTIDGNYATPPQPAEGEGTTVRLCPTCDRPVGNGGVYCPVHQVHEGLRNHRHPVVCGCAACVAAGKPLPDAEPPDLASMQRRLDEVEERVTDDETKRQEVDLDLARRIEVIKARLWPAPPPPAAPPETHAFVPAKPPIAFCCAVPGCYSNESAPVHAVPATGKGER